LRFCDVDFGAGAATGIPPLLKVRNRSPAGWCELLPSIQNSAKSCAFREAGTQTKKT